MMTFLPYLKHLLTHQYRDGVDESTLYEKFFCGFGYDRADVQIGILELSGAGYVDTTPVGIRATASLYDSEIEHLRSALTQEADRLEQEALNAHIAILEEYRARVAETEYYIPLALPVCPARTAE
jgi:hypothetical protein